MTIRRRQRPMVVLALLVLPAAFVDATARPQQAPAAQRVNEHASALADFKKRVDAYLALQKEATRDAPPQQSTESAAQIKGVEEWLAAAIVVRRTTARHGDIFTPEIQSAFRTILAARVKGDRGRDSKSILKDDAPATVPLKVNAKYPPGASLPTVPADLLVNLPTLPDGLDFRIVNRHLVLRDAKANLIVDFIANAMP